MNSTLPTLKKTILFFAIAGSFIACKKDDNEPTPALRNPVSYTKITDTTTYSRSNGLFVDASGKTTVDFTEGALAYKEFQALNAYLLVARTRVISADTLAKMYTNTGNTFADASLNASGVKLSNLTASSWSTTAANVVREKFNSDFTKLAAASQSFASVASPGTAGKLGTYLLDAKGLVLQQIVQKGLIGAYQLDIISNILLNKGLEADNTTPVAGKNYTQLEHNWDLAFATLTPNANYLMGATVDSRATTEFALGSYAWEYNRDNGDFAKIRTAFLKGRAAIVNNDRAEINAQALFIRQTLEKTIANASIGYLNKWKDASATEASRANWMSEGLGMIYSLRFCTLNNANAEFSDKVLSDLIGSVNGFWDLTPVKINAAADAIQAKF